MLESKEIKEQMEKVREKIKGRGTNENKRK